MINQIYQSLRNFLTRIPKNYHPSNRIPLSEFVRYCNETDEEPSPFPEKFARMVSDISTGKMEEGNCFVTASGLMFLLKSDK